MAQIEAEDISKQYVSGAGRLEALKHLTFSVEAGDFAAIMGPSGSGKTTLMNLFGLLDRPSSGKLRFEGRDVSQLSSDESADLRNLRIGFVFQTYNLLSRMTAFENVELPLLYARVGRTQRHDRVREILEAVGLGERLDHWPTQLSGGEQQRVAIARAMITRPGLLLADEPTGALDSKTGEQVMRLIRDFNETGTTVILVTHNQSVAEMAKRVIAIADGRISSAPEVTESLQMRPGA